MVSHFCRLSDAISAVFAAPNLPLAPEPTRVLIGDLLRLIDEWQLEPGGLEVDALVQANDGRWATFEVKHGLPYIGSP